MSKLQKLFEDKAKEIKNTYDKNYIIQILDAHELAPDITTVIVEAYNQNKKNKAIFIREIIGDMNISRVKAPFYSNAEILYDAIRMEYTGNIDDLKTFEISLTLTEFIIKSLNNTLYYISKGEFGKIDSGYVDRINQDNKKGIYPRL